MVERAVAERAERLSRKRARLLPFLAVVFLAQQVTYFSTAESAPRDVDTLKISAWLVLSVVLVAALATKGFWLQPKEVRDLIDDENTRANRGEAMRWGFIFAMIAGVGVYIETMFEAVSAREAVHLIMTTGIAVALIRWGVLERRAHRDG